ncbi:hypothetical protein [Primorskyibacter sedentarius]|uniref:Uncharacterized protein n=1 Tax=Primorskyibacter sedentarius TaxID=745311 RepID=A0A4R3JF85_9RHOB|nr:hypothetical protein [Primorskyibacter sedentarius]TCS64572.1 hypothetical protein EDD52_105133 [Primorskyibacter sedentarius]
MSNIGGKAYAMNVVTPSNPKITWINRLLFMASRGLPENLQGLLGLSIIHFARWVIIRPKDWPDLGQGKQTVKNDYMLFCSNFNGTWDQYIDAFSDGIPKGLNLFWYSATKYPQSIPVTTFKNYITYNQVNTDYYYNATPGSAQRDIKSSLRVYDEVRRLAKLHASQSPEDFAKSYRDAMFRIQDALGEPGIGPVASLDTERADINRSAYVKDAQREFDSERTSTS